MKPWLESNNNKVSSVQNEGESVVAEQFIRTLKYKNQIYDSNTKKSIHQ